MSITRTAKGTAQSKANGSSLTLSSVAIAAGASIVVFVAHDPISITSVTWNSIGLTKDVEATNGSNVQGSIWSLHNASSATGNVVVTFSGNIDAKVLTAIQLSGIKNPLSLDVFTSATGTGTAPSSGATGTLANSAEFAVGAIGFETTSVSIGTWQNSFTDGQNIATSGGTDDTNIRGNDGYFHAGDLTNSTAGLTASKTGAASLDWAALIAVYQEGAAELQVSQNPREVEYSQSEVVVSQNPREVEYGQKEVVVSQNPREVEYSQREVEVSSNVRIVEWVDAPANEVYVSSNSRTIEYIDFTGIPGIQIEDAQVVEVVEHQQSEIQDSLVVNTVEWLDPPQIQDSQVIETLEYSVLEIQDSQVIETIEVNQAEIQDSQVIETIEYLKEPARIWNITPEKEVDWSFHLRNNQIYDNFVGMTLRPETVFFRAGSGLVIEDNTISDNRLEAIRIGFTKGLEIGGNVIRNNGASNSIRDSQIVKTFEYIQTEIQDFQVMETIEYNQGEIQETFVVQVIEYTTP